MGCLRTRDQVSPFQCWYKKHVSGVSIPEIHRLRSVEDAGGETGGTILAITYLTVIETAKMWELQVKEYLTYVWREVMSGRSALPLVPKVSRILTMSQ